MVNLGSIYVLWACKSGGWEHDYMHELFPGPTIDYTMTDSFNFTHYDAPVFAQLKDPSILPRVLVYNIENAGDDGTYPEIRKLITTYKFTILVHTADEFQGSSRKWKYGEGVEVYHLAPLVLRQYGIFPYRNLDTPRSNVMQLPLGYMRHMLDYGNYSMNSIQASKQNLHITAAQRNMSWAFIGTVHGHKDRAYALAVFSDWKPFIHDAGLSPIQMREIYLTSRFVVVGRGQSNLDCYRIYEAIICGAVPIVVGPKWERERAFEFEGDLPPFVFEDDYPMALARCRNMSFAEIDRLREANVAWYTNRIQLIKNRINLFLTIYSAPPQKRRH